MGVNLTIITDPQPPDPRAARAEFPESTAWVTRYLEVLDELATRLGVSTLGSHVYEPHPSEYDPGWEEGDEVDEDAGVVHWHAPGEVLTTIDLLAQSIQSNPGEWASHIRSQGFHPVDSVEADREILLEELAQYRKCLVHVHERGARFHFAVV